jgi:hypothetical protein
MAGDTLVEQARQWAERLAKLNANRTLEAINGCGILLELRNQALNESGSNDINSGEYRYAMNRLLKQSGLLGLLTKHDQAALLGIVGRRDAFMAWYSGKPEKWRRRHTRLRALRKDFETAQGEPIAANAPAAKVVRKVAGQREMTAAEIQQVLARREADLAERDAEIAKLRVTVANSTISNDMVRNAGVLIGKLKELHGKAYPKAAKKIAELLLKSIAGQD